MPLLQITCPGCDNSITVDPAGPDAVTIEWMPGMERFDPDGTFDALSAKPCSCCTEKHHHGVAANVEGKACRPLLVKTVPDQSVTPITSP
jgi:hypothetical protein